MSKTNAGSSGDGHRYCRGLQARPDALGQRRSRCAFSGFRASRRAHQRRGHPLAPWRLGPAAAARARQSAKSHCWYKIAARLAKNYHVILPDLRGYGDSSLPEPGTDHINYSFRAMSEDLLEIMDQLGYRQIFRRGPRSRRAHDAPHVHGSSRAHHQSVPDGHRAEPLRVDAHDQELGDRHLALGLHGAARAVSGAR